MDASADGTVDKDEIFAFLFNYLDTNGDGVWNATEVKDFIRKYAALLHRNLTTGWEEKLEAAIEEIDNGFSARELELALSKHNADIRSFK